MNNWQTLIATINRFPSEVTNEIAVEADIAVEAETANDSEDDKMKSPRTRSSTHSLSFSGTGELSDLIAKARSEFNQTLLAVGAI